MTVVWILLPLIVATWIAVRVFLIPAAYRRGLAPVPEWAAGPMAIPADQHPRRLITAARMGWTGRVVVPPGEVPLSG